MHWLKSAYVSVYISGAVTSLVWSLAMIARDGVLSPWLGTALACAGPVVFFGGAYVLPSPRTSADLPYVLTAGVVGTLASFVLAGLGVTWALVVAATVGVAGTLVYVRWYSRFGAPANDALRVGNALPAVTLVENGHEVGSAELVARPALWIFYRGNWCPLCTAQIREIAGQYRELARRGVEVFLVSPQPEANTTALAASVEAPMRFLTDRGNTAAAVLGILEKAGLPAGMQVLGYDSDVPRPTVFITAAGGRLIYCDLTDNYRVRPEPSQFFAVLDAHAIA